MCARLPRFAAALAAVLVLSSCGDERTGTAFCAQLGRETPAIGAPITTKSEATAMVERYERLLGVSPLSIEKDMQTLVDLLRLAASVDTTDAAEMQELADASYAANQAALNVRDWAKSTCAVDISTGLQIDPPRTVPPTTVPPDTVPNESVPNESVPAASVPAETVPTESVPVSTP